MAEFMLIVLYDGIMRYAIIEPVISKLTVVLNMDRKGEFRSNFSFRGTIS
jgi:hypothetical protein